MQKVAFVNFVDVTVHYINEATNIDINCDYMSYHQKGVLFFTPGQKGGCQKRAPFMKEGISTPLGTMHNLL